jgi:fumarate reductase flavoprotein subunit
VVDDDFSGTIEIDCLIIGGGAAGLTAALAASEDGASVLVAERENYLSGSTALSSGLIPAAETRAQKRQNISDKKKKIF